MNHRERMVRMGLWEGEDFGGARPVARIEYVNRPLFDPESGDEVVVQIHDDRLVVSLLHPPQTQRASINDALAALLSETI